MFRCHRKFDPTENLAPPGQISGEICMVLNMHTFLTLQTCMVLKFRTLCCANECYGIFLTTIRSKNYETFHILIRFWSFRPLPRRQCWEKKLSSAAAYIIMFATLLWGEGPGNCVVVSIIFAPDCLCPYIGNSWLNIKFG